MFILIIRSLKIVCQVIHISTLIIEGLIIVRIRVLLPGPFLLPPKYYFTSYSVSEPGVVMAHLDYFHFEGGMNVQNRS